MKQTRKKILTYAIIILGGGVILFVLIESFKAKNTEFETKTLWDWMELLIIPLVLAIGVFYLNRSECSIERQIAEERAKLEREIATDRQQEVSLQAYLDRISDLLKEDLRNNTELRNIARIRTLTVLRGLDAKRKGLVLLFLQEANLIDKEIPVVNLNGADLQGAHLENAKLRSVNLEWVNLQGANLKWANLDNSILVFANLEKAILHGAYLRHTDMHAANLEKADLSESQLNEAKLTHANLKDANLDGCYLISANLANADIAGASMRPTVLVNTTMPDGTVRD